MQSKIKDKVDLKNGTYKGLWSGYTLKLIDDKEAVYKTLHGVRGINIKCILNVRDGVGIVKTYNSYDKKIKKLSKDKKK